MKISLDSGSQEPLFVQIVTQIREKILSGELKSGEQLQSIRSFTRENEVSAITILKAYQTLVDENLIISSQGRGYYVSDSARERVVEYHMEKIASGLADIVRSAQSAGLNIDEVYTLIKMIWSDKVCHGDTLREDIDE